MKTIRHERTQIAKDLWAAVDRAREALPQWIKDGKVPQKYPVKDENPDEQKQREALKRSGFQEIRPDVWRKGYHVILSGPYKPLAKDFEPSIKGIPCS